MVFAFLFLFGVCVLVCLGRCLCGVCVLCLFVLVFVFA